MSIFRNTFIGVIVVAMITILLYSYENIWKLDDATLNDIKAYYKLHGEYPTKDRKTNLIDIELLYGDNIPPNTKEKLLDEYQFYLYFERSEEGKVLPYESGDATRVLHTKKSYNLKNFTRNGSVLTWSGPESGDIFEWIDNRWVYVAKFEDSKFIYADPHKEYAIGNYGFQFAGVEFSVVPLIQLEEEISS